MTQSEWKSYSEKMLLELKITKKIRNEDETAKQATADLEV